MAGDKIFTCQICGKDFSADCHCHAKYCPECREIATRQKKERYARSEEGKARRKELRARYIASGKNAEWQHRYRERHLEQLREEHRIYSREHPEINRKAAKKYYYAHREERREKHRQWTAANQERICEKSRRYREEHREDLALKERLRRAVKQNKPGARLAWAKATGKLTYCERMRVTMYPLPCGTRGECKGCKHCPEGAACGNDGHFRWDMESLNGGRSFR